jgi:hypothetical protein
LDTDLGVEVEGGRGGGGYFGDGFVVFDEGPGGDRGEELGDGCEAGFVVADGVVGAPLLARLVEEDADAGFALVVGFAGGGWFEDSDEGGALCLAGEREE